MDQRIWRTCLLGDDCWEYQGWRDRNGYGRTKLGWRRQMVHRTAYEIYYDVRLEPGVCVLHRCDNPPCIRPDHLFVGNDSMNMLDCVAKGRHPQANKTHCPSGHEYTEDNTERGSRGERGCKTCRRERDAARPSGWKRQRATLKKDHPEE